MFVSPTALLLLLAWLVQVSALAPRINLELKADFSEGNYGFSYKDNAFRSTEQSDYTKGYRSRKDRSLVVEMENSDNQPKGLSGAWCRTFELIALSMVHIGFDVRLELSHKSDKDSYVESMLSFDGEYVGMVGSMDYVSRLAGGKKHRASFRSAVVRIGRHSPGNHTFCIGGFLRANRRHEASRVSYRGLVVRAGPFLLQQIATAGGKPKKSGPSGVVVLKNVKSGKCVDIWGASGLSDSWLAQATCTSKWNQLFAVVQARSGFVLQNPKTKLCLDASGDGSRADVAMRPCNNGKGQILTWNGSSIAFRGLDGCLDLANANPRDGAFIQRWRCNNSPAQFFIGEPAKVSPGEPPSVYLPPPSMRNRNVVLKNTSTDKCVDIWGGSKVPGAWVAQAACTSKWNQIFKVVPTNGGFVLQNPTTDLCLATSGTSAGTDIVMRPCNNEKGQVMTRSGNSLRFQYLGTCLDTHRASISVGTVIQVWHCHGGNAQQFAFEATELVPGQPPALHLPPESMRNKEVSLKNSNSRKCIEIWGFSRKPQARLSQANCNRKQNQQFQMVLAGGGFKLQNLARDLCIGVSKKSMDIGAGVLMMPCDEGNNQIMTWTGKSLRFQHSGMCLEVKSGSQVDDVEVLQWHCKDQPSQYFTPVP